jgi:hypothetical protein
MMPGMSYNHMRSLTENYAHGHLIADNILQEAWDSAKKELFGDADDNVRCSKAVKEAIISMGHSCELLFSDRRDVICSLRATVVREELKRREDESEPTLEKGNETERFIEQWLIDNERALTDQLGMEDGPPLKFLTGIFIATSTSKLQGPFLQDVIQADAAHVFWKVHSILGIREHGQRNNGSFRICNDLW